MGWSFERTFYGHQRGLNLKSMHDFLARGYYFIPYTLFEGYYRAVSRVGDHDGVLARVEKPFPDVITAQKPEGRFALHLSGGFDSAILAKLYDGEEVDYIHFTGPESEKARTLAATLKGTLHEVQITPESFIQAAEELLPHLVEPYAFEDITYAYLASKKARELGHTLVVSGDGGDGIFGGANVGPYTRKALVVWKTLDPNKFLGLETLQPFMHSALYAWSKSTLTRHQVSREKRFAAQYCRELGMPKVVSEQRKGYWAGSLGTRANETVLAHMAAVVDRSDYAWIRQFEFPVPPCPDFAFRQYGLVHWLQAHYKAHLDSQEIQAFVDRVRAFNAAEGKVAATLRWKERVKKYVPPIAITTVDRVRRRVVVRPTVGQKR